MSLFQAKEFWTTKACEPGTTDIGSLVVGNIDNNKDGIERIVVGSLTGDLSIYTVAEMEYRSEDLLFHTKLAPVLQLEMGAFSSPDARELAILHPREIAVYTVKGIVGQGVELSKIFGAKLERTAANFVPGRFGGAVKDVICVQSMDGALSFYNHGRLGLVRFVPDFLVPGPLCYLQHADAIITSSATWAVCSYKFLVLASAGEAAAQRSGDSSQRSTKEGGKRVTSDWECNIGEEVLQLRVCGTKTPCILALGRTSLFWIADDGSLLRSNRIESPLSCCLPFRCVGESAHVVVCGTDGIVRVMHDKKVAWAAGGAGSPVAVATTTQCGVKGLLTLLDENGTLSVVYLGTDPRLPVLKSQNEHNYEAMDSELKRLQKIMSAAKDGKLKTVPDAQLQVEISDFYPVDPVRSEVDPSAVFQTGLTVSLSAPAGYVATDVVMRIVCERPLICDQVAINFEDQAIDEETAVDVRLAFASVVGVPVSSLHAALSITYTVKGQPQTYECEVPLPLTLAYDVAPPNKTAQHKITIATNHTCITMNELFPELLRGHEMTPAIGFRLRDTDEVATVISAKTSSRYRIQADSWSTMAGVLVAVTRALRQHFSGSTPPLAISMKELPSLSPLFTAIDTHFHIRRAKAEMAAALGEQATQFRSLQKRLLARVKDVTPSPIDQMSSLLEATQHEVHMRWLFTFDLDDAAFHRVSSIVSPHVVDTIEQGWEESTLASLTFLISTTLARSEKDKIVNPGPLQLPDSTDKLHRYIKLFVDRLPGSSIATGEA
ncbi:hypothetical protein PTSG_08843 [Salpingoeca rosetta]|uniref:PTHB1 N-terminal domain-containing protein n=1 Tax=Salpingoeca rosetta (strain ATCC 50818 / BSB-021) TaxID=946362 RepID=F2UKV5_SALR5|nr:uncharacterized protein PTSG_08843 [Salpingoeca rosetta]EGD77754.1 hypothetical protein PTSG_08843 [Salpingoeca rosetta]|eukprot:XP_004990230.1 hypothetical protein PTSG_08843 [Salpingoeca rosetta]